MSVYHLKIRQVMFLFPQNDPAGQMSSLNLPHWSFKTCCEVWKWWHRPFLNTFGLYNTVVICSNVWITSYQLCRPVLFQSFWIACTVCLTRYEWYELSSRDAALFSCTAEDEGSSWLPLPPIVLPPQRWICLHVAALQPAPCTVIGLSAPPLRPDQ